VLSFTFAGYHPQYLIQHSPNVATIAPMQLRRLLEAEPSRSRNEYDRPSL